VARYPAALRLDGAGNPVIAAITLDLQDPQNSRMTMATAKYNTRGQLEWKAYYNSFAQ
jgi:hypothetical protein